VSDIQLLFLNVHNITSVEAKQTTATMNSTFKNSKKIAPFLSHSNIVFLLIGKGMDYAKINSLV